MLHRRQSQEVKNYGGVYLMGSSLYGNLDIEKKEVRAKERRKGGLAEWGKYW